MYYLDLESSKVELKEVLPKSEQLIKTIIGFCNRNGGKLVIGVADDGTVVGVLEEQAQQVMEYLSKSIYEASSPPIIPLVYAQAMGGKMLLIIEVAAGMNKPYFFRSEGLEKGVYVRLGRSTMRAGPEIIEELKWQSRGKSFDTMPVYHAAVEDINLDKVKEFLASRKGVHTAVMPLEDAFKTYHLVVHEHGHLYPTVAALLVFGKNPQHFFSQAFIICTRFAGTSGRQVIATIDCTGTLINQFYSAYDFVTSQLHRSFIIKGPRRKEMLEIPEVALREVLINALVHRNYHIQAPIKIALFDNRVEVFSPGDFPGPINAQNLLCGLTYSRNIAIAKLFRHLGFIETLGSGFLTIFESYRARGLPLPEVIEGENYVKCILPRQSKQEYLERHAVADLKGDLQRILDLFAVSAEVTISDVMQQLKVSRATAGRRLTILVHQKLIKQVGSGKAAHYVRV
jgi:ATP-dependent DNA helicase RecG